MLLEQELRGNFAFPQLVLSSPKTYTSVSIKQLDCELEISIA